ncbi:hypothetical protein P171DRAFT_483214 [Karstenula rhodostoma CBS 690.94]|uniref:Uncharacterized protein n=1 Tax=Karstenula rhodostoma CBS 690.94 TaxID=1392251 RepID=A0A9P4PQQ2_9PLEO|nr:hypothetical protein P171DRAFT_483214 [Karstenula rhodostoma CBS 690.94]
MDAIETAHADWSRQDILALLQLLTMILMSIVGAFWHLIVVRPTHIDHRQGVRTPVAPAPEPPRRWTN